MYLYDDRGCRGDTSRGLRIKEGIEGDAPFGRLGKHSVVEEFCSEVLGIEENRYCSRREIVKVIDTIIEFHLGAGFGEDGFEVRAVEEVGEVNQFVGGKV